MSSRAPAHVLASAAVALSTLLATPPVAAQASPGELALGVGIGYAGIPGLAGEAKGVRSVASVSWGLPRGFALSALGARDELFGPYGIRGSATTAGLGVTYLVDVLTVVPFVELDGVAQWRGGNLQAPLRGGLRGVLGADWRRWRAWSVGAQIEWHGFFPDLLDYPAEAAITLRATWYLDLRRW